MWVTTAGSDNEYKWSQKCLIEHRYCHTKEHKRWIQCATTKTLMLKMEAYLKHILSKEMQFPLYIKYRNIFKPKHAMNSQISAVMEGL